LTGNGRVNLYSVFAETDRSLLRQKGRAGVVLPTGIATDDTNKIFFGDLVGKRALASLYDFENRKALFAGVHRSYKFSLVTVSSDGDGPREADLACFLLDPSDLAGEERHFTLSTEDFALINPNTLTLPIFRSKRDAELTKAIYRRVPVLVREGDPDGNPWGIAFRQGLFNMTSDSGLFRTRMEMEAEGWRLQGNVFERGEARYLPLYEAKMLHQFDHRWATYDGLETRDVTVAEKADPHCVALPRYWVPEREVQARLERRWDRHWLLGWRDICRSTDERTVIASVLPRVACGDTLLLMFPAPEFATLAPLLGANLDSFVLDFAARQKIGGTHLKYHVFKQLATLPPDAYIGVAPWCRPESLQDWLAPRALELTYTAWDMQPFARDLGYDGPPFAWDPERRFHLRCELDAAFFHLYGIERDDVDYIMETFPIVKRKDEAKWGEYRTKRVILEVYDAMRRAMVTGVAYDGGTVGVAASAG